ncbi:GHMP family kinase ATP-binding protein [Motilibacter aurantiacus]|uniref:GHMP family kinase ATP-binding protein n=1 Tax=Motilibacter aurantiacus TaxID=2714955 RepID=UPI00140A6F05|nr:GHMP kinase [Motilibacter aurantiacus]NHC44746.1 GHMP kinase [Motilibacter aurantiacus]
MRINTKAPLRVSFAGGGTDVSPFPESEGGAVLSATIDRYAYGSLSPRGDDQVCIESVDYGLSVDFGIKDSVAFDGKLDLAKAAVRKLCGDDDCGFDLFLHSNAPPGSGLGSSSTMMVALIGLLVERSRARLSDYEIAQLAYSLEREDLGIKGGLQDQYAAVFGGFNYIEFFGDHVVVNPLRVKESTVNELEHNLLLCYTGITREGKHIIDDQTGRVTAGEARTVDALRAQKRLALEMKRALLRDELDSFGSLLGSAWEHKKQMSPRISTPFIDEAYDAARRNGALGGKVTGAGGGGYLLLYCDFRRKHRVAEALLALGATVTEFSFESRGLMTWRVP